MNIFTLFFIAFTLALPVSASPFPQIGLQNSNTTTSVSGKYIIKVKDKALMPNVLSLIGSSVQSTSASESQWKVISGISGTFDESIVKQLRDSEFVELVEEDILMHASSTQIYTPWGLQRISSPSGITERNASALSYTYSYDRSAGSGVDIYVVDTGINISHSQFCGGRAKWGATFGKGNTDIDDSGHGTHIAGIAAGNQFGVAKNATLIAVKVLDSTSNGLTSDIISGLDWVYEQVQLTQRPSVVSLSFGGGRHDIVDAVVNTMAESGIHVVVSAGNNGLDADIRSPARAENVIAVGAANITDEMAYYSNYGSHVAVYAPGGDIVSAWNTDELAINVISGTSMAAPHVSGAVAAIITHEGNMSPKQMKQRIQNHAIKDVLKGVPNGTNNFLLQVPVHFGSGN